MNLKFHYCIYKYPPTVHILSQLDPVLTPTFHFLKIYLDAILPSSSKSSKWSPSLKFLHQIRVYTSPLPTRATCPAHLILLYFITRTILDKDHKSLSCTWWSFYNFPVTSSLLGQNIILNTPLSSTLTVRFSLSLSNQVSHIQNKRQNYNSECLIFTFLVSKLEDRTF
jgi:hypothetical protein